MDEILSETRMRAQPPRSRWRRWGRRKEDPWAWLRPEEGQVDAELFGAEQLRRHARALGESHRISGKPNGRTLLRRLADNAQMIERAHGVLKRAAATGNEIPKGSEWLLDNYYLIQQQIRLAARHLPHKYSAELPTLASGAARKEGLPRVYDLARELIRHVAGQIDPAGLETFVAAYQEVTDLKVGELWAIPIMLRLALIENIRRTAIRLAWREHEEQLARQWAERIAAAARESLSSFIRTLGQLLSGGLPTDSPFAARFVERLQGQLPHDNVALTLLQQQLQEQGLSLDSLVDTDSQSEAADQLSIGNSITSLRSLDALNWKQFVESRSAIDQELAHDPARVYQRMDFESRDYYRHVVERLARRSRLDERGVARAAVELARQAAQASAPGGPARVTPTLPSAASPAATTVAAAAPPAPRGLPAAHGADRDPREGHVGFYLLGEGKRRLARVVDARPTWAERLASIWDRAPLACFLGSVGLVWLATILAAAAALGFGGASLTTVGAIFGAIVVTLFFAAASHQFAVSVVNWLVTLAARPRPVMRLDFTQGIPPECGTLVVVPTMLSSRSHLRAMIDQLEARYLANREEHLWFALLTDFPDADQPSLPGDAALLELARAEVELLNAKYRRHRPSIFFLLHRERRWNAAEGAWMGHERKRGKLADLNRLLRSGDRTPFAATVGDLSQLTGIRYVITLDSDTGLPAGTARKLVGCMAHPLNLPRFDSRTGTIVRGHGVLQPRVTTTLPSANTSLYSQLFAGDAGVDPYTPAASNVYQDVFGEGTFMGKGIYDVYAFETALADRFPENRVLSHDLIEGCFARSGLASDVEVFESFPSRFLADTSRRHRWIRGDWQIAAWLGPRVPTVDGAGPNPLSWLSRWKIFDNLRRSLYPVALLAFLTVGWLAAPSAALVALAALTLVFGPGLLGSLPGLMRYSDEQPWRLHLRRWWSNLAKRLACDGVDLAVLPYTVHCNLDAIARVLDRLYRTRRKLLEWTTSDDAERRAKGSYRDHYELMWSGPFAALALAALLSVLHAAALPWALPLLVLWLAGPAIACRLSQPRPAREAQLSEACRDDLRRWARCTWRYFEDFPEGRPGGLVPDNVQWRPHRMVAARTSPTDLGMGLVSALAAHDLGYLTASGFLAHCGQGLSEMLRLERYRGHLYNWYDSVTMRPLEPRYVSTVDSGNLWGALLLLRAGLEELRSSPVFSVRLCAGLRDAAAVLANEAASRGASLLVGAASRDHSPHGISAAGALSGGAFEGDLAWVDFAQAAEDECRALEHAAAAAKAGSRAPAGARGLDALVARLESLAAPCLAAQHNAAPSSDWFGVFQRQVAAARREIEELAFWIRIPAIARPSGVFNAAEEAQLDEIEATLAALDGTATLAGLAESGDRLAQMAETLTAQLHEANGKASAQRAGRELRRVLEELKDRAAQAAAAARNHLRAIDALIRQCDDLCEMDFTFLYDPRRKLLAIGYNATELRRDESYYDLLASEARLASFLAVSRGQLPIEHWFTLGRLIADGDREPVLLSWSGSMFEYLMPMLFMPSYENTMLDEGCRAAVRRQMRYAREQGIPWGISESCYNVTGADAAYQYHAFGVPGLAMNRGMPEALVVAPYASALALMVAPQPACENLRRLEAAGCLSPYGFVDALDFTAAHRDELDRPAICQTVMSHHAGMALGAMAVALGLHSPARRLLADPWCRAHVMLLHERVPDDVRPVDLPGLDAERVHPAEGRNGKSASAASDDQAEVARFSRLRVFESPHTAYPEIHLLSNENYLVMLSAAGGGQSRFGGVALTRWRNDATRDAWGQFLYLRDLASGAIWSNTYQPVQQEADQYRAVFSQGQVEYRAALHDYDVRTQVSVSPEEDVEVRRLTITNLRHAERTLELTSYAEVVLAPQDADEAHAAFGKLFVETEIVAEKAAIICRRRPARPDEAELWMFHTLAAPAGERSKASFETSRERFLGRHRNPARPQAMESAGPLAGEPGPALDPIVSIRRPIAIAAEQSVQVDVVTGVADSREAALALIEKYHDRRLAARVFEMARAHSQLMLQHLEITEADAQLYATLASALLYHDPRRRADRNRIARQLDRQDGLWPMSIGGDLPIVLVRVEFERDLPLVEQMTAAHAYWRRKGIRADLVIYIHERGGYHRRLRERVVERIITGRSAALLDRDGGIHVLSADQCTEEQWSLLQAAARVALIDDGGRLEQRLRAAPHASAGEAAPRGEGSPPAANPLAGLPCEAEKNQRRPSADLLLCNGLGGFTPDGKEYIVTLGPGETTPAPWSNVIANPHFGTLVTEAGLGCTWAGNSQQFRLTPWSCDPVSDPPAEAIYLRDEETRRWMSPTPQPRDHERAWTCRHGFGYSVWQGEAMDLATELWTYVSVDAPVKFLTLTIRNRSNRRRRLSAYYFLEWVLGQHRGATQPFVVTSVDSQTGAVFARNRFHPDYSEQVAFVHSSVPAASVSGDRAEFLGRYGSIDRPAALAQERLSGRCGAGLDPAAAVQCMLEIEAGQQAEIVFVLGAAGNEAEARRLAARYANVAAAGAERARVWDQWNQLLGRMFIETPDASLNVLANGWLPYQTIACRLWGRTAFYQSSGAYGFRDQLQDVLSLLALAPWMAREHLLRAAQRQFREGDVQHWWHDDTGRGVRTRVSDDLLWLPLAVARYVQATGDAGVLDEAAPLLVDRPLAPDETSRFARPASAAQPVSLYEHCRLALRHAARFGEHGLPLFGSGDWNDGMDRVGVEGQGESVWLGFFLAQVLAEFGAVAQRRDDASFAAWCRQQREELAKCLEEHAWSGHWYLRGYFDDGQPLGSPLAAECQIDSLPQSWAVLSGAGSPERSAEAMAHVRRRLVRREQRLVQLFDPPLDRSRPLAGYIQAYIPGVRENGGQYTHAAVWVAMALAELREAGAAWECLSLINPVESARSPRETALYRLEPYVVAADVGLATGHAGRGGWSWYTGSAGWMQQAIVESILGVTIVDGRRLRLRPCPPPHWPRYRVYYRFYGTHYHIEVVQHRDATPTDAAEASTRAAEVSHITLDGAVVPGAEVPLVDDGGEHHVVVTLGQPAPDRHDAVGPEASPAPPQRTPA